MDRLSTSVPARLIWDVFPHSREPLGIEWNLLDTFDGYSPRYHGVFDAGDVEGWFRASGLVDIQRLGFPTAVRGRKPERDA